MKTFFSVGPSKIYPKVYDWIKIALDDQILSISHRSADFEKIYIKTATNIRKLLSIPKNYRIYFLSSATEGMERILQNTVEKNSFHFVNGAFSKRFYEIANELNKNTDKIEVAFGSSFDFENQNIPKKSELVCLTHNETSTGVMIDESHIENIKNKNPNKLIVVDAVSSAPYIKFNFKNIDALFFSVQKGFGIPSGLGVLILSEQAFEKSKYLESKNLSCGSYHSFKTLEKYYLKNQTPETPNILDIYLLGKVAEDMNKKGLDKIRRETEVKSEVIVKSIKNTSYSYLVSDLSFQSKTVHVLKIPNGSEKLIKKLQKQNIVVSTGYGNMKKDYIRIANFPAHTKEEIEKLCSVILEINKKTT